MNDFWKSTTPGKGMVYPRNFDEGLVRTMGGVLTTFNGVQTYVIPNIPCAGQVPIYVSPPDPLIVSEVIPRIIINPSSMDDGGTRIHPGHVQWQDRHDTSPEIDHSGFYQEMDESLQAWPYDISYEIEISGSFKKMVQGIWKWIMANSTIKPKGYITVWDDAGDPRGYDVIFDSITESDAIDDIYLRFPGMTVTLRVMGEIDIMPIETSRLVEQTNLTVEKK